MNRLSEDYPAMKCTRGTGDAPSSEGVVWKKVRSWVSSVVPWIVVGFLLWSAFSIRPAGLNKQVIPPPISPQDRFYGAASIDNHFYWLAGNLGKIVFSKDGGKTWQIQSTPTTRNLQGIAAWNKKDVIAVGDGGTVLVTHDSGQSWKRVAVPQSKISNKFIRVHVFSDGTAWIVGEVSAVLRSTDKGETWQQMLGQKDITLHDIAQAGNELVVVGEMGTILLSGDDGTTWTQIDESPTQDTLNSVDFRNAMDGVAVGLNGSILTTKDGGQQWHQVDDPTDDHLFVVRWNGSEWLAAGSKGVVVSAGPDAQHWTASRVGERDFSWHTGLVSMAGAGWMLVGGDTGLYRQGNWKILGESKVQR